MFVKSLSEISSEIKEKEYGKTILWKYWRNCNISPTVVTQFVYGVIESWLCRLVRTGTSTLVVSGDELKWTIRESPKGCKDQVCPLLITKTNK